MPGIFKNKVFLRTLIAIGAIAGAVKLISLTGGGEVLENKLQDLAKNSEFTSAVLNMETGAKIEDENLIEDLAILQSAIMTANIESIEKTDEFSTHTEIGDNLTVMQEDITGDSPDPEFDNLTDVVNTDPVEITVSSSAISIKNGTDYTIDVEQLLNEELNIMLSSEEPQILILHTHGSEAYYPDGSYTESDAFRTEDTDYNVVKVGDVLAEKFTAMGLNVIHDRELYDYPSYSGSYNRALEAIEEYIEQYPSIRVVIDLHRDAISADGSYKTTATVDGKECSQLMLVMGTDYAGLVHPDWRENLKLAVKLQAGLESLYPGITRPINIEPYRYNQHATTGSLILEVGATGNTLQESIDAVTYFADVAGRMLVQLVKQT